MNKTFEPSALIHFLEAALIHLKAHNLYCDKKLERLRAALEQIVNGGIEMGREEMLEIARKALNDGGDE